MKTSGKHLKLFGETRVFKLYCHEHARPNKLDRDTRQVLIQQLIVPDTFNSDIMAGMDNNKELNLGAQPIIDYMEQHGLNAHDLVAASVEQITHKMVARACKGRRLSPKVKQKVLNALNNAAGKNYTLKDVFNY